MGLKRTNVFIDEEILFLARYKGLENLSDFVRKALEAFVLDDEDTKIPNPIHEKARAYAEKVKHELRCQKKIINEREAAALEVQEYQQKRAIAIEAACIRTFLATRNFSRSLPENDPDSDHFGEFEHAVSEISRLAGYDVDPAEVIQIYHQKTRTRYTGSREVEALTDTSTPFCDDELTGSQADDLYRRTMS